MTIKEIAELCGVDQSTVWRWAQKDDLLQNAKGITEKLEEARKSGKDPAGFTLDETLTIIGEGGGRKALASLLEETAVTKEVLAVQSEAITKIVEWYEKHKNFQEDFETFEKWVRGEYQKLEGQQDRLEAGIESIEKINTLRKYGLPFLLD
jgi:predicted transcriptional regulator